MSDQGSSTTTSGRPGWLTNRVIGGIVIAVVLVIFVVVNRDATEISFILFKAEAALWVALTVAGVAGFLAGFLLGRKRYRP